MKFIQNMEHSQVLDFAGQVSYLDGQIASKTLAQDSFHSLTLFAFDRDEEISAHVSEGDALVIALDGEGQITIDGQAFVLHAGESILMPARAPTRSMPRSASKCC